MTSSIDPEQAVMLAISLLKHRNPHTIQLLQDLLTFIPNPDHVKEILMAAVRQLVYRCPKSALWLFHHPELLEPQLQVRDIIAQEITQTLLSWGYQFEDFHFTAERYLVISDDLRQSLSNYQSTLIDDPVFTLIGSLLLSEHHAIVE